MTVTDELVRLPLEQIVPHPHNVRGHLGDLADLAKSIEGSGIIAPLVVLPADDQGRHVLVAGHRRHAAAGRAKGVVDAPCVIRDLTEAQVIENMLVENLQRAEITPIEEARGYARLVDLDVSIADIARAVGRSQKLVKSRLALLVLPDTLLDLVEDGRLPLADAAICADEHAADDEALTWVVEQVTSGRSGTSYGSLGMRIERHVAERTATAEYEAQVAKATQKGLRIYDPPPGWYEPHTLSNLSTPTPLRHLGLTVAQHRAEPCHAVRISRPSWGSSKVTTLHLCTNPKRHTIRLAEAQRSDLQMNEDLYGGATKPGVNDNQSTGDSDPESKRKAIEQAAFTAQKAAATQILAKAPAIGDDLLAIAIGALHSKDLAAELLGLDPAPNQHGQPTLTTAFERFAEDPANTTRAFTAIVLAHSASWATHGLGYQQGEPWLRWLLAHGYEPGEDERPLIDEALDRWAEHRDAETARRIGREEPTPDSIRAALGELTDEAMEALAELLFLDKQPNQGPTPVLDDESLAELTEAGFVEWDVTDDGSIPKLTNFARSAGDAADDQARERRGQTVADVDA